MTNWTEDCLWESNSRGMTERCLTLFDMTAQFKKRTGEKMGGGFAAAHFLPLFLPQAAGSFRMKRSEMRNLFRPDNE